MIILLAACLLVVGPALLLVTGRLIGRITTEGRVRQSRTNSLPAAKKG